MKNLKKVLAMVLAFACTFSMFAGAKVFEDVPAGSDYSEAITMLSDLGIIQGKDDGKYHPEDTITRAEACAMIARLMTGDPNVSQYVGAQSFTDVAKGSWKDSAIGYCYINGIVIGVGNNKFEPDRAITDAEFVTMVVRAMGYETADMKQNYPFSYMSNAQAIGLLDGTNMVASTDALRGEDAQVIYNALFADYARGAKLVNTTHGTSVETYPTLAESVWGLERAAVGTWKEKDDETATLEYCKAHTWVVLGADPTAEGHIIAYAIEDDSTDLYTDNKDKMVYSFKYAGDADAVAGYQVELWGEGSHGEPEWESKNDKYVWSDNWEIKAIKTVKGQTAYDYNASMADSKSENGEIVLGEETLKLDSVADNANDAEKVQSVDQYLYEGYHGEKKLDDKKVEKALNVRDGAQYKLVDWDSDGDIDWVVADTANYYKVEAVNSTRLTVSSMKVGNEEEETNSNTQTWKLNDLTEIDKVKYDFGTEEDLAEGDIIEVTYTTAYDKGEKAEVVTATITKVEADTAELDKVSTKDTLELTFDGEVKKVAEANDKGDVVVPANPKTYGDFDDEELGTSFNLWMNRNGFIVYSDYANETVNYLMVLDTGDGSDKTGDRKLATMDVLYADNSTKKDVEVVSDLKLDGYDKDDRTWDESEVVGNVYKYWADEDGTITKMESVFSMTNDTESAKKYTYDSSTDRLKEDSSFIASLEEADVIFAVTKNDAKSDNTGYIEVTAGGDYKVDAGNVLAVKQADIPDIALKDSYTETVELDGESTANYTGHQATWLGDKNENHYIAEVNGNGEASAAILGVTSFNKFNAAATTVGLVTSVSYDKNDVVEIEVAYKGEVTTVKSAEDVDFEDVVKQFNGTKDVDLDTKTIANRLKDNALYAEITTNADGKLTAVTFMNVNGNVATGHYYEVSRRIITDVTTGDVAYGTSDTVYYNNKNLYSVVDRLKVEDKDLADEVDYYTIDGRPTTHDDKYEDVTLAIVNGFDGTPDITAATDSNLVESYINNKFDDADTYYVADLAYKIDGDIVAAYAFEDSLGEVEATNGAIVAPVKDAALKAGESDKKIADVTLYDASATVSNVTIKKDGVVVTNVQGKVTSNELQVSADSDAAVGTDYTAEFTVGTGKDARTYTVKFAVEAATVAVPTTTKGEVTKGVASAQSVPAKATVTFKQGSVAANDEWTIWVNGDKVTHTATTTTVNDEVAAFAKELNNILPGLTATESANKIELTYTKGALTVESNDQEITAETTQDFVAAVDRVQGKATLTITSGVNVDTKLALRVDGAPFTAVEVKAGATAEDIADAIVAAHLSYSSYDVTNDGAVITVEQKAGTNKTQDMVLDIVAVED